MIPASDVKVEIITDGVMFLGFVLTSPSGVKYHYGKYVDSNGQTHFGHDYGGGGRYSGQSVSNAPANGWQLLAIESADGHHRIRIEYVRHFYEYLAPDLPDDIYAYRNSNGGLGVSKVHSPNHVVLERYSAGLVPSRITVSSGLETVDFGYTLRDDLREVGNGGIADQSKPRKLSKITVNTGTYCFDHDLAYSYFRDDILNENASRLKLESVTKSACDGSVAEESWVFSYSGRSAGNGRQFFPALSSHDVDHWGYYNYSPAKGHNKDPRLGNTSSVADLVPRTELNLGGPGPYFYGSANRESNEGAMPNGMLQRVTYPTGGSMALTYEANSYQYSDNTQMPFSLTTDTGQGSQEAFFTYTSAVATSANPRWELCVEASGQSTTNLGQGTVEIFPVGSNTPIASYSFSTANFGIPECQSGLLPTVGFGQNNTPLTPGQSYRVKVSEIEAEVTFKIFYDLTTTSKVCGGLRVKRTVAHDGISTQSDIVQDYRYLAKSNTTASSGVLARKPRYEFLTNDRTARLSSFSLSTLTGSEGYHIGYERVVVDHNGIGEVEYLFAKQSRTFPTFYGRDAPSAFLPWDGKLLKQTSRSESGQVVAEQIVAYEIEAFSQAGLNDATGLVYSKQASLRCYESGTGLNVCGNYVIPYLLQTAIVRPVMSINTIDGVATTTSMEYGGQNHLLLTAQTVTNSDGKLHSSEMRYPEDMTGAAYQSMEDKNILLPVETLTKVDGTVVGGSRARYQLFGGHPYPQYQDQYEVSWLKNGTLVNNGWSTKTTVHAYDDGFPTQLTRRGWEREYYTWLPGGRLHTKTYEGFESRYDYYPNTRLVSKITDVDGQFVDYGYDGLMRYNFASSRGGAVTKSLSYVFPGQDPLRQHGYVNVVANFQPTPGSELTELSTYEYVDGLGRPMQTVKRAYSEAEKDVVTATTYDQYGRPVTTYAPTESLYADGRPLITNQLTDHTTTTYYADPLARVKSVTPPDWHATLYAYGMNAQAVSQPGGTSFPVGSLATQTVTDPNGNKVENFTDKLGRAVLSQRLGTSGQVLTTTTSVYDDKNRVSKVYPPGSGSTSPGLLYQYVYDGRDRIVEKQVPDQGPLLFWYDDRDLPTFTQDANMAEREEALHTKYDVRGRLLSTGLTEGVPTSGEDLPTYTYPLTTTCYDGCKLEGGVPSIYRNKPMYAASRVLGSNQWLEQTFFYDTHGRVSRTEGNNPVNYTDNEAEVLSFTYDFADNLLSDSRMHSPGVGIANLSVVNQTTFDHSGRTRLTQQSLEGTTYRISEQHYSPKDQVVRTLLGHASGTDWLQQVDYQFLPNGFLSGINEGSLFDGSLVGVEDCVDSGPTGGAAASSYDRNDLFSLKLYYDSTPGLGTATLPQRNGNIAGYRYRSRGRTTQAYAFGYDNLDRLSSADHAQQLAAGGYEQDAYNASYTYDLRGNISSLIREGKALGDDGCLQSGQLDNLTYDYFSRSNRIERITDTPVNDPGQAFIGAAGYHRTTGAPDLAYQYDANGNMIYDPARELTIYYNYLNLPERFAFEDCRTVDIVYSADGTKVGEVTSNGSQAVNRRAYVAGIEYVNGRRESVAHAAGRTYYDRDGSRQEFNLTDHLGNVRLVFSDLNGNGRVDLHADAERSEILTERNYYPFGLEMAGNWLADLGRESRYRYNGIEHVEELGLDMAFYRTYDAAIGRWMQIDPKAESFAPMSPYTGMGNNPILITDPLGDSIRLDFISGLPDIDRSMLTTMINHDLEGQFETSIDGDGILSIVATEGGGDASKLSENGQAFYSEMSELTTGDGVATVKVDRQRSDVHTGNFALGTIDVSDMAQFNSSLSDLGGTRGGKIAHEFREQYTAQTAPYEMSFGEAHRTGVAAENRVNMSVRSDRGSSQVFSRGGREVSTSISTTTSGSGFFGKLMRVDRRIISVKNSENR